MLLYLLECPRCCDITDNNSEEGPGISISHPSKVMKRPENAGSIFGRPPVAPDQDGKAVPELTGRGHLSTPSVP